MPVRVSAKPPNPRQTDVVILAVTKSMLGPESVLQQIRCKMAHKRASLVSTRTRPRRARKQLETARRSFLRVPKNFWRAKYPENAAMWLSGE